VDAIAFILGMVAGTAVFAALFEPLKGFYLSGQGPQGQTLMDLTGLPEWLILLALVGAAFGAFKAGNHFEKKFGGPLTAEQVVNGTGETIPEQTQSVPMETVKA
jgi:hypothetical protein